MAGLTLVTILGVIALVVLVALFLRMRRNDVLGELMQKRRASSKLVSRAELVQGNERLQVILALDDNALHYENPEMDAAAMLDLSQLDTIEYDDELSHGKSLEGGCRALRTRSHGVPFEFVLAPQDCEKWMAALPARTGAPEPIRAAV